MYRYQVASQVVLATERSTTRLVLASVRFRTIRIVSLNMRLQIERTSECWNSTLSVMAQPAKKEYIHLGDTAGIDTFSLNPSSFQLC